jgi:hypothetical protein
LHPPLAENAKERTTSAGECALSSDFIGENPISEMSIY